MLSEYGDILSGEQVRRILHISKRKCAWMLNNGFIKCKNTSKKSRKYIVLKADLIEFIEDLQEHPERYNKIVAKPEKHESMMRKYMVDLS